MEKFIEKFLSLDIKIRILILLLLTAYFGYDSFTTYVVNAESRLEQIKTQESNLDRQIEEAAAIGQTLPELEAKRQAAEKELMEVFEIIPKSIEIDEVLSSFSSKANESGVEMSEFVPTLGGANTPQPPPQNNINQVRTDGQNSNMLNTGVPSQLESISNTVLKVKSRGTYEQVKGFIEAILRQPRVIRLDSLKLKSLVKIEKELKGEKYSGTEEVKTAEGQPILEAEISFKAYFQEGGVDILSISQPLQPDNTAPLDDLGGSENSLELNMFNNLGNFANVPPQP